MDALRTQSARRVTYTVLVALVPPLVTFAVQRFLWTSLSPFAWFLFYSAVFISSWYGGFWSGVGATLFSTLLVWSQFIPLEELEGESRLDEPRYLVSTAAFVCMGLAFSTFHERLRRTMREKRIFQALIENSSDFIGIADAKGRPIYVNPAGRRMVGLSDRRIEDTQIPEYYTPDQRAFATDVILSSMISSGRWEGETRFRNWKTQAPIAVSDAHFMIRDGAGELLGMGTITRDITEVKRAEAEQRFLAEVGAVLASTIDYEGTLTGVVHLVLRDLADCCTIDLLEDGDVHRMMITCRDPALQTTADALQHLTGPRRLARSVLDTGQPLLMNEVTDEYLESIAQNRAHLDALRRLAPKALLAVPLRAHAELLGMLVLMRTSARRYESKDIALATEVAWRAALAVHNAQLYAIAKRATEARDELLGVVAHDLRNPLSAIMMQTHVLQRGRPEGDRRSSKGPDTIRRAATRMRRLIDDLLDVSQMEAGHFRVEPARVAPSELIEEVVATQRELVTAAAIELRVEVPRSLPDALVDHDRIVQVIQNLVGNSTKFTPKGGTITIGATHEDGVVHFSVRDTGAGVAAQNVPHVFDRFWQEKKGSGGAGLGLAIARGIVEAHGGRIWVESAVGVGSTFHFTVPVFRSSSTSALAVAT